MSTQGQIGYLTRLLAAMRQPQTGSPTPATDEDLISVNVQPYDQDLTAISALSGTSGLLRKTGLNTWTLDNSNYLTTVTNSQVTAALGYTPVTDARTLTINGVTYDLTANRSWTIAGGVTSFNTRTGAITLLSSDITSTLGYTPYNASNPAGYISSFTETDPTVGSHIKAITTTNISNWNTAYGWGNHALAGYLTSITSSLVTAALGYTPYNATNPSGYISGITSSMVTTALGYTPENLANKGVANGYASLDGSGLVPSTQLPSYVDDVLEYANVAAFPGSGSTGKIYVALDTNKIYRWSGATYIEVSPTVGTIWGGITGTLANQTDLQSALDAKVPTVRTLTINGTTYDLSADRSWTITSMIYPGAGIAVSTGTAWGTSITDNSANWNTAYSWGNHASAGYLLSSTASSTYLTISTAASTYLTSASASSTYLTSANAASTYLTISNAASSYQPLDGDLTAIAGLAGTSGFLKKTAANTWSLDTNTYLTSYTETDPIYVASSWYTTTNNSANWNTAYGWGNHASAGYLTTSVAASTYQPLDGDLTAIAGLAGTSGFLKKTAANTWSLDTNSYLTSFTETDPFRVTAVAVSGTNTKTITITRADASTVSTTWTDYDTDTNTYVTSAAFTGGTLTLTRNDAGTVSVSLDGRYYLATNPSGYTTNTGTVTSVSLSVPTGLSIAGSPITTSGTLAVTFTAGYSIPTTASQTNWDTAYGWGNHASAGYLTTSTAASTYQPLDADLTSIAGLAGTSGFLKKTAANTWTLDTNTYLTSYTETDPVYVASTWYSTTNNAANWNTAYGWGNHASAGYLTGITSGQVTTALGYTPVTNARTLTINGTAYDLSADRSWTISAGTTLNGTGFVKASGTTITYDNSTYYLASNPSGYTSNTGTVTSVGGTGTVAGLTLTGTVTTSGNLTLGGTLDITSATGLLRSRLAPTGLIDSLTTTNFRTTLFGASTSAYQISTARWNTTPTFLNSINPYSTMFAWAGSDTHGFVAMDYNAAVMIVGGGNADVVNWSKRVAFTDGTGASGTWGISISGNAATATTATTASSATSATNIWGPGGSYIASQNAGTSYSNHIQIREAGLAGAQGSNGIYAPALGFHWSGVVASNIVMEASGRIVITNNPGTSYEAFAAAAITCTSLTETSSKRYKENITSLDYSLPAILQLEPVSYNRIGESKKEIGFIAEDVESIIPEVIEYNYEGEVEGISYGRLTAVLIEAVKEQQKQIDELKNLLNSK